jgi:hypothetical protein
MSLEFLHELRRLQAELGEWNVRMGAAGLAGARGDDLEPVPPAQQATTTKIDEGEGVMVSPACHPNLCLG